MAFRISLTPTADRSARQLRGKVADSFGRALTRLEAEGCTAADYRLSGDVVDHICSLHLYGRFRVLLCFPDNERTLILLIGEHIQGHPINVYGRLYEFLGIGEPDTKRSKSPCCDDEGRPPVDPDLVDRFIATANRLRQRR